MPPLEILANVLLAAADLLVLGVVALRRSAAALVWGVVSLATGALLGAPVLGSAFGSIRILAATCFLHLPLVLLGAAFLLRRARTRLAAAAVLAALGLLVVAADAFLIEPRALEVNRHRLAAPGLAAPLRIAVVADLQTDRAGFGEHEKRALRAVLAERPDVILLPGDFVQEEEPRARAAVIAELNGFLREIAFSAPLGAFAVGGNVDSPDWPSIFDGTAVVAFERRADLEVGGLHLTALAEESSNLALGLPREGAFHLAFGHHPDFALSPRVAADLLVAGHTHGGQVRLPFIGALLTLSHVPRAWAAGVTDLGGGRTLVVSRGIGLERGDAPRLRFLCRPEVVVLDLVTAPRP